MKASRIKLSDKLTVQKSTITQILLWMQEHPLMCRNTNISQMARTMTEPGTVESRKTYMNKMVNNQMIHRDGGKRRATFTINYLHKDITPEVLAKAPKESKKMYNRMTSGLKNNQYISKDGCKVTLAEPVNQKIRHIQVRRNTSSSNASDENSTIAVPVKVKRDERGMSISITLNINLN